MGFNFMAALGGAASQIVDDIDEQEKEVKLRTRTILDRQVAQTAENQKAFQIKQEKAKEQLNSVVQLFDANDPFRYDKARQIVAGGPDHFKKVYSELSEHKRLGGDINQAYEFVPDASREGKAASSTVDEALKGIVTMRTISQPKISESVKGSDSLRLFGVDPDAMYNKARAQYEKAGLLIPASASSSEVSKSFGSGTVRYENLKKASVDTQTQLADINREIAELAANPDTEGFAEKMKKLEAKQSSLFSSQSKLTDISASVKAAKINAGTKDTGLTFSNHRTSYNDVVASAEKAMGYSDKGGLVTVTGPNGKMLKGADAESYYKQKIGEAKKSYALGLLDDNGDYNNEDAKAFAKIRGLEDIVQQIRVEKFGADAEGDGKEVKVDTKKGDKNEKATALIKENPELNEDVALGLVNLSNKKLMTSPRAVSDMLQQKYPKKQGESQEDYLERVDTIAIKVWDTYKNKLDNESNEKKRLEELRKNRFKETNVVKSSTKTDATGTLADIYKGGAGQVNQKETNIGG